MTYCLDLLRESLTESNKVDPIHYVELEAIPVWLTDVAIIFYSRWLLETIMFRKRHKTIFCTTKNFLHNQKLFTHQLLKEETVHVLFF